MTYRVEYSRRAANYYRRQTEAQQQLLAERPYDANLAIPLRGKADMRRMRVGDLRVLFQIVDDESVLLVVDIGPRGDIYRS